MPAANNAQSTNAAQSSQGAASAEQQVEPLKPPAAAEGTVTTDKMDKAAEWAAYAATAKCAEEIAKQVEAAAKPKVPGNRPVVLVIDVPIGTGGSAAAGQIAKELERSKTELEEEARDLDALLRKLDAETQLAAATIYEPAFSIGGVQHEAAGLPAAQAAPPPPAVNIAAILAALAGAAGVAAAGAPAALAAITAGASALPGLTANIGSVVGLAAASLAYLRADYSIKGATVEVSEHALRMAAAGEIASGGTINVKMLDMINIADAPIFEKYDEALRCCVGVKRKAEAVNYAAQVRDAEAAKLEAWRTVLRELRWGIESPDIAAVDAKIESLDTQIEALRADQLRFGMEVKKAAGLTTAFDAYAAKLVASVDSQPAPVVLAALRETVDGANADAVLHVKLHSVGGTTTEISKTLFWFGGGIILTGHATASYVMSVPSTGLVVAAGMVGFSTSAKRSGDEAKFKTWEHSSFTAGGAPKVTIQTAGSGGDIQQ